MEYYGVKYAVLMLGKRWMCWPIIEYTDNVWPTFNLVENYTAIIPHRPRGDSFGSTVKPHYIYCRSGNIREVLIFANFARRTNLRIQESRGNYY